MFHPPRRARSQSPKSSHGGADINVPHSGKTGYTPGSADLGNFGWALQQTATDSLRGGSATRGGPLTPRSAAMLNGPGMTPGLRSSLLGGGSSGGGHGSSVDAIMFDPTSIRTGFTPGGANGPHPGASHGVSNSSNNNTSYPPHSPATQALFAMMTNATPGLPALPRIESEYSGSDSANEKTGSSNTINKLQSAAHIQQPSRHSSGSGRSPESNNSGQVHSQAVPRPINASSIYGNRPNPMAIQQASSNPSSNYSGYQSSQALLSQIAPRPLPPQAFSSNNSGNGSSQNGVPQTRNQQQQQQQQAGQNPLYMLSQQLPSDIQEDDTVLAAAALSGLSTPRGTYVGGPGMPTIAPSTLTNNAGKMNLQQPPQGSASNNNSAAAQGRPMPLSKANSAAQPSAVTNVKASTGIAAAAATAPAGGKKGPATSNKRKKTDDAPANSKKPKRNTRRAAAANAQPIVDADTLSEDELDNDNDGASIGQSDNGRNASYYGDDSVGGETTSQMQIMQAQRHQSGESEEKVEPPRKGGRGPKQQFETEEEKRKNFLERNRQGEPRRFFLELAVSWMLILDLTWVRDTAALKCRQRKKQWLGELQQRVENLTQDNEVLQQTCNHLREEVMTLRNILLSHKDCPVGGPGGQMHGGPHATIGGLLSAQAHQNGGMHSHHPHHLQHQQQQQQARPY